jgi:hypothetical protein
MNQIIISFAVCFGIVLAYVLIRLAVAYIEYKYRNHGED